MEKITYRLFKILYSLAGHLQNTVASTSYNPIHMDMSLQKISLLNTDGTSLMVFIHWAFAVIHTAN
jgi:hypothetical protein